MEINYQLPTLGYLLVLLLTANTLTPSHALLDA